MLTKEDLKAISNLIDERMDKKFEDFAIIVNNGFCEMEKRFEQVDKRFEQMDKRFEQMDKRFDKIESEIADIKSEIADIKYRLDNIEGRLDEIENRLCILENRVEQLVKTENEDVCAIAFDLEKLKKEFREYKKRNAKDFKVV